MNRKRRTLLLLFLPLAVLMAVSSGVIYRDYRQQRLNQNLIAALKRGDVGAEVRLLNAGANANAQDMGDQPVTIWGVLRDYWQRLRTGEPVETEFHTPAILVFRNRFATQSLNEEAWIAQIVPLLDHRANINIQSKHGQTALFWACFYNYSDVARLLIDKGADANIPNATERHPLQCSIDSKNLELVRALLNTGAKANQKDERGFTPLWWARHQLEDARRRNIALDIKTSQEIVRLLKQAGAHE